MLKKNIWANFQRIIDLFTQKNVTKLSKIWVWDPIANPGSRGQKGTDYWYVFDAENSLAFILLQI